MGPSTLPKLFFCADEALHDFGNDLILALELVLECLDFSSEPEVLVRGEPKAAAPFSKKVRYHW